MAGFRTLVILTSQTFHYIKTNAIRNEFRFNTLSLPRSERILDKTYIIQVEKIKIVSEQQAPK